MIEFKADTGKGYRELVTPIQPRHARLAGYEPDEVIELLARMWGYPATEYDAYRLLEGSPAEVVVHKWDDALEPLERPLLPKARYLHGCDVAYFDSAPLILEMLQRDRCFVSLDPLSISDLLACKRRQFKKGLFVVHQLDCKPFPMWSEDRWKSFCCEARPHISFQFP